MQNDEQQAKEWPVSKHKCREILNELLLSNQKNKYVLNQPNSGQWTSKNADKCKKGLLSNQQRKNMPNQPKEGQWKLKDAEKYKLGLLEQSKVQNRA